MDTTDSMIKFDVHGVCDHCRTFENQVVKAWAFGKGEENEKKLNQLIQRLKNEGAKKEYDCLLGLSGGIDSSYLLHYLVTKHALRPLVFHVDAGWNTKESVNNIQKIVDKLDLDLHTEVINWKEMADLQLAFFKSGVPHIDTPQDHAYFATMYRFASQYKIKNIITGGNYSTEGIRNPLEWMWYQSDSIQLRDVHQKYGRVKLKSFPLTNILWHKVYLPYVKKIKLFRPLDFIEYDKKHAVQELTDIYGFIPYPQKHFESRFTRFYESYWLPERFGYDTRKVQFSSLILTGQMTREEALKALKKKPYDESTIHQDIEYVATKLGISVEELNSYMTMEKKTYKAYKSQESIFLLGARVMRALGLEKGGKR
jgi:N-acetyl sugar amidotransferase